MGAKKLESWELKVGKLRLGAQPELIIKHRSLLSKMLSLLRSSFGLRSEPNACDLYFECIRRESYTSIAAHILSDPIREIAMTFLWMVGQG